MKKISIIVPAHNSEKHITKCLDSLVGQSYTNVEIIIVNDGSTDETSRIVKEYQKEHSNIILCEQKKSGANAARRNGIKKSTGDYLMFVDSDDYIAPNTVNDLAEELNSREADIIKFQFLNLDTNKTKVLKNGYNKINDLRKTILTTTELNNITTEIISKRIINLQDDVFDIVSSSGEDLLMNLSFLDRAKKVRIIDKRYYYYTDNANSTTKTKDINSLYKSACEAIQILEPLLAYANKWKLNDKTTIDRLYFRAIKASYNIISKIIVSAKKPNNERGRISKIVNQLNRDTINTPKIIKAYEKNPLNKLIYKCIYYNNIRVAKVLLSFKQLAKHVRGKQ